MLADPTTLVNPDKRIDCTGFFCPIPVIKAREAMASLAVGQLLEVLADDPSAEADVTSWAARAGHVLMVQSRSGATHRFLVRKAR